MCELYMLAGWGLGSNSEVCVARRKHVVCSQAFAPLTDETCRAVVHALAVATRNAGCMVGFCQSLRSFSLLS